MSKARTKEIARISFTRIKKICFHRAFEVVVEEMCQGQPCTRPCREALEELYESYLEAWEEYSMAN